MSLGEGESGKEASATRIRGQNLRHNLKWQGGVAYLDRRPAHSCSKYCRLLNKLEDDMSARQRKWES